MENVVAQNPLAADLDRVLADTGTLWEDLRGARLFITGGTGFFGCWLLETFCWATDRLQIDASVSVLTRDARGFEERAPHLAGHSAVTLHEGDVRNFEFPAANITHIVHAAADPRPVATEHDRQRMWDTIADGTRHVLEFAHHARASRFLLISSGAVYGRQPSDVTHLSEDYTGAPDPTDRQQAYGEAKRAAEMLCALHADATLHPTIARCFAFTGPYLALDSHFAAGNFIRDALLGGPVRVKGDGTPCRSYLYAADLVSWLWTILLRGTALRPYNVGSPDGVSILELARTVARLAGPRVEVQVAERPDGRAAPHRYVPSTQRAEQELGLRSHVALEEGLRHMLEWYRRGMPA